MPRPAAGALLDTAEEYATANLLEWIGDRMQAGVVSVAELDKRVAVGSRR